MASTRCHSSHGQRKLRFMSNRHRGCCFVHDHPLRSRRYRKESHGGLDDAELHHILRRLLPCSAVATPRLRVVLPAPCCEARGTHATPIHRQRSRVTQVRTTLGAACEEGIGTDSRRRTPLVVRAPRAPNGCCWRRSCSSWRRKAAGHASSRHTYAERFTCAAGRQCAG